MIDVPAGFTKWKPMHAYKYAFLSLSLSLSLCVREALKQKSQQNTKNTMPYTCLDKGKRSSG